MESETYNELLQHRILLDEQFQKKESVIYEKKQKLFMQRDISKWQCAPEQINELKKRSTELFNDR